MQFFPGQHFYCDVRAFVHFSGKSPGRTRDYLPGRRQLCKVSNFDLDSSLEMRKGLMEGVGALAGGGWARLARPDLAQLSTMSVGMLDVRAKRPQPGAYWPVTFKLVLRA